jgi:hypothetical protein
MSEEEDIYQTRIFRKESEHSNENNAEGNLSPKNKLSFQEENSYIKYENQKNQEILKNEKFKKQGFYYNELYTSDYKLENFPHLYKINR